MHCFRNAVRLDEQGACRPAFEGMNEVEKRRKAVIEIAVAAPLPRVLVELLYHLCWIQLLA